MLNETKLNKSHVLRFKKYNVVRSDREEKHPGGGTAILIKKTIKFNEIILPPTITGKILEHTIIKLNITNNNLLYIIAVYAKCGN